MTVRPATAADARAMAAIHAASFDAAWSEEDILALMTGAGGLALATGEPLCGFIIGRSVAGEAELLTLAVAPATRGAGFGRALVEGLLAAITEVETVFLEVAADNAAALALYRSAGFEAAGMRRGYYPRPGGGCADALILRRALNTGDA